MKEVAWIDVKVELPDYEVPVYLKLSNGDKFVGFRDFTDKQGERYVLLSKSNKRDDSKIEYWAKLDFPNF